MSKTAVKDGATARRAILNRIARIEGQVRGVRRMVETGDRCLDVMAQIMAARSALSVLGMELLKQDILCGNKSRKLTEAYLNRLFTIQ